jgi:hypothetical protein
MKTYFPATEFFHASGIFDRIIFDHPVAFIYTLWHSILQSLSTSVFIPVLHVSATLGHHQVLLLLLLQLFLGNFAFISFLLYTEHQADEWVYNKKIKAKLQWNSCSNNSNITWWWPNVTETCSTGVKTDELKVALRIVILSVKVDFLTTL